jgi:hypothetical protein
MPGQGEERWPEQRPMTPADFDRPYVDEAAERFVEQAPAPEIRHESASQPAAGEPSSQPETPAEERSTGERKRGWWKRVLSSD